MQIAHSQVRSTSSMPRGKLSDHRDSPLQRLPLGLRLTDVAWEEASLSQSVEISGLKLVARANLSAGFRRLHQD